MSQNSLLSYRMQEAWNKGSLQDARQAYKDWQVSHCYHPTWRDVYDAHTGKTQRILTPCGKCYHCRESHINEWVTRMYAHMADFKNVYFVTLTYRSYQPNLSVTDTLALDKLSQAAWHIDSFNETKRRCWSPCKLCKSHYQDFLKRLRKYSGIDDLSYVVSGEYGHQYGRPHFHFIFFTNYQLDVMHVRRAWSIALFHHYEKGWSYKTSQSENSGFTFYHQIGKIDFNDLVRNGTISQQTVKVDGNVFNAGQCFSYVCKYVCKNNDFNRSRLLLMHKCLFEKQKVVKIYDNYVSASKAEQWLMEHDINYDRQSINNLKQHCYEKVFSINSPYLYQRNFKRIESLSLYDYAIKGISTKQREAIFFHDFKEMCDWFAPFVEFSRGTPIGSLYAKTHVHEFAQGVFNRPLLQGDSFVVPKYFFTKAQEYIYGLREVSQTIKGSSCKLGLLPDMFRRLEGFLEKVPSNYLVRGNVKTDDDLRKIINSSLSFVDKSTGEHIIFRTYGYELSNFGRSTYYKLASGYVRVECYKYDRHFKTYYLTRDLSVFDFANYWLDKLADEYKRYAFNLQKRTDSYRCFDRALCLATDLGFELHTEQDKFESEQTEYLTNRDKLYHEVHSSAE